MIITHLLIDQLNSVRMVLAAAMTISLFCTLLALFGQAIYLTEDGVRKDPERIAFLWRFIIISAFICAVSMAGVIFVPSRSALEKMREEQIQEREMYENHKQPSLADAYSKYGENCRRYYDRSPR